MSARHDDDRPERLALAVEGLAAIACLELTEEARQAGAFADPEIPEVAEFQVWLVGYLRDRHPDDVEVVGELGAALAAGRMPGERLVLTKDRGPGAEKPRERTRERSPLASVTRGVVAAAASMGTHGAEWCGSRWVLEQRGRWLVLTRRQLAISTDLAEGAQ